MELWSGITFTLTTLVFIGAGFPGEWPPGLETLPLVALVLAYLVLMGPLSGLFSKSQGIGQLKTRETKIDHQVMTTGGAGYQAAACSEPLYQPSGDFCFLMELESRHLAFFLGDAMGHGRAASEYQEICQQLLRRSVHQCRTPGEVVSSVNEALVKAEQDKFATLLFGLLEPRTGRLDLLRAGHPRPIHICGHGRAKFLDCPACLPLGMLPGQDYQSQTVWIDSGDTLVLYSDGLTEARNAEQDFFGEDALLRCVRENVRLSPERLADTILRDVERFSECRDDDQTVLVLRLGELPLAAPFSVLERTALAPSHCGGTISAG